MSKLKRSLVYFGLGRDDDYESSDAPRSSATHGSEQSRYPIQPGAGSQGVVSVITTQPPSNAVVGRTVRPVPIAQAEQHRSSASEFGEGAKPLRSVETKSKKPFAVSPRKFNDAPEIGKRLKAGQPVIVNLQEVEDDVRRRLIDFSAGLCYASGSKMDRVADHVFMLTPADVQVSQ